MATFTACWAAADQKIRAVKLLPRVTARILSALIMGILRYIYKIVGDPIEHLIEDNSHIASQLGLVGLVLPYETVAYLRNLMVSLNPLASTE